MRKIVGLIALTFFWSMSVAYGAGSVWDFVGASVTSDVRKLPDPPETLEIWDFWNPGESVNGGGGTGSLPLPGGRTESGGGSRPRGIADPPETLEIWDFWTPGGSLEVWAFAGGEME